MGTERTARSTSPTTDELSALVRAVARTPGGNALVVAEDNSAAGWEPIEDLVGTEAAFAVVPARDVLALDCDHPEALGALESVAASLERAGITAVVVASGGEGRRHLFARVADAGLRRVLADVARSGGIDVRGDAPIRPPGVRHRSGREPELLAPSSWAGAVAALGAPTMPSRMPQRLWRLLRDGDTEGRYRRADGSVDDSRLCLAACNVAVLHGMERERAWALLCDPRNRAGASIHKRLDRPAVARRFFDRTWAKAQATSWAPRPVTSRNEALVELARLEELADQVVFWGRTANSDRAVLSALYRLGNRHGGVVVPVSVRALAEESGRSVPTVRASLRRLREWRMVELVRCSERDRSAVYRLLEVPASFVGSQRASLAQVHCPRGAGTVQVQFDVSPGHDAFAPTALGAGGYRVLRALSSGEGDTAELRERVGLHRVTLRRHLGRLVRLGIVEALEGGSWRCVLSGAELVAALDAAAKTLGTTGRAAARRLRHRMERAAYQAFLTVRDVAVAATGGPVHRRSTALAKLPFDPLTGEVDGRAPPLEEVA